jgi:trans-aconitate methyltransferase
MQNLPSAAVYELEFTFMPWGKLITEVQAHIVSAIPNRGMLIDMFCGPGYLLGKLQEARPDVAYMGIDFDPEFIQHASKRYPRIEFLLGDAFEWETPEKFDVVTCTAGVHHLPDEQQEPFIGKLASLIAPGGFAIIADPYIEDFETPKQRLHASARFGYEYLEATIENDAPPEVIDAAVQVLRNDVLLVEWKTSVKKREAMLVRHFKHIRKHKTWPSHDSDYGDYYFIVSN